MASRKTYNDKVEKCSWKTVRRKCKNEEKNNVFLRKMEVANLLRPSLLLSMLLAGPTHHFSISIYNTIQRIFFYHVCHERRKLYFTSFDNTQKKVNDELTIVICQLLFGCFFFVLILPSIVSGIIVPSRPFGYILNIQIKLTNTEYSF